MDADRHDDANLFCMQCGYALRGLADQAVCPECGTSIESSQLLMERPEHLALPFGRMKWSFATTFGVLLICGGPGAFAVVALVGVVLRSMAIVDLLRIGWKRVPTVSRLLKWLIFVTLTEAALLFPILGSGFHLSGAEVVDAAVLAFAWPWMIAVAAALTIAAALARPPMRRLEQVRIMAQLRTSQYSAVAAVAAGAIAFFVLWATNVADWFDALWFSFALCTLAMLVAVGHGITALAHTAGALRERS